MAKATSPTTTTVTASETIATSPREPQSMFMSVVLSGRDGYGLLAGGHVVDVLGGDGRAARRGVDPARHGDERERDDDRADDASAGGQRGDGADGGRGRQRDQPGERHPAG